jgi:hypothetical protein
VVRGFEYLPLAKARDVEGIYDWGRQTDHCHVVVLIVMKQ